MYTGYFAKIKEYEQAGLIPISIAAKAPDWYDGLEYKKLAPKYDFFMEWKKNHDNDYYIKRLAVKTAYKTLFNESIEEAFCSGKYTTLEAIEKDMEWRKNQ